LLAVNQNFIYVLIKITNRQYYIAKNLLAFFLLQTKITDYQILNEVKGNELILFQAIHPLYKRVVPIVHSDHVNLDSGTGIVHIAPGFGIDDFNLGLKHNLKVIVPIDDQGKFTKEINDASLVNQFYEDTNKIVITSLKEKGNLVGFN